MPADSKSRRSSCVPWILRFEAHTGRSPCGRSPVSLSSAIFAVQRISELRHRLHRESGAIETVADFGGYWRVLEKSRGRVFWLATRSVRPPKPGCTHHHAFHYFSGSMRTPIACPSSLCSRSSAIAAIRSPYKSEIRGRDRSRRNTVALLEFGNLQIFEVETLHRSRIASRAQKAAPNETESVSRKISRSEIGAKKGDLGVCSSDSIEQVPFGQRLPNSKELRVRRSFELGWELSGLIRFSAILWPAIDVRPSRRDDGK